MLQKIRIKGRRGRAARLVFNAAKKMGHAHRSGPTNMRPDAATRIGKRSVSRVAFVEPGLRECG